MKGRELDKHGYQRTLIIIPDLMKYITHLPKSVIHLGCRGIQQKEGRRRNAVIDESFLLDDQLHLSLEVIMGEPECSWTVKTT